MTRNDKNYFRLQYDTFPYKTQCFLLSFRNTFIIMYYDMYKCEFLCKLYINNKIDLLDQRRNSAVFKMDWIVL